MRTYVENWTPPTSEHEALKEFMLQQIDMCTKHLGPDPITQKPSFKSWKNEILGDYTWNIDYYTKELAEDKKRDQGRYNWCKNLIDSVNKPEYETEVK